MRLAGTWIRYSNSAMPQLASAATYHGDEAKFFRCPYHAKVMNRLDTASISAVTSSGLEIRFIVRLVKRLVHAQQFHFKHQRRIRRDHAARALPAVAHLRRNDESALAAHL